MIPSPIALTIVVPCYNEVEALPRTKEVLLTLLKHLLDLGKISRSSRICFVDDGSKDDTWSLIERFESESEYIQGIKLSRNFGHQNALLAGLFFVQGDAVVSIDADLQDDVQTIESMLDRFYQGDEIVYGVRNDRKTDRVFKRVSAEAFYKLMRFWGADVIYNHADFRLMSQRAIEAMREFSEVNLFLRGIVPLLGFRSSSVYYERSSRSAGHSKYPFRKMVQFALQGITSFSIIPLKLITSCGFIIFLGSCLVGTWALISKFCGKAASGWLSTVLPIMFLGGVQILSIGILGEYIGKIYNETKRRPRFIIDHHLGFRNERKTS